MRAQPKHALSGKVPLMMWLVDEAHRFEIVVEVQQVVRDDLQQR